MPNIPTDERVLEWLQRALSGTAHGFDLHLRAGPDVVDRQLLQWEDAGWILRGVFDPDLSQRALNIVPPSQKATMAAAREALQRSKEAGADLYQSSYWWLPGSKAAEILAKLPPSNAFEVGEEVRYRGGFLRSIGMTGDDTMLRWRGIILEVGGVPGVGKILVCSQKPVDCHCCLSCPEVDGKPTFEKDCPRCDGTGVAKKMRVNTKNVERVHPKARTP